MTITDLLVRLFANPKGVTADRIAKAKGLAARNNLSWEAVLKAMTTEQRKAVNDAE